MKFMFLVVVILFVVSGCVFILFEVVVFFGYFDIVFDVWLVFYQSFVGGYIQCMFVDFKLWCGFNDVQVLKKKG